MVRGQEQPRTAGISSFGAGGSNAHLIVQEYVDKRVPTEVQGPALVVLSAKSEERLRVQAQQLHDAIDGQNLHDIAYTLQVGREAMQVRLACVASTTAELQHKLRAFINNQTTEELYSGEVKRHKEELALFTSDEELMRAVQNWISQGKLQPLAQWWVKGLKIDWDRLHGEMKPQCIALPTYPFSKEQYWIDPAAFNTSTASTQGSRLHPLLHENTSDLSQQRFSSLFTGSEFFLRDHRVLDVAVMPGVAQLEMAREAVQRASPVPQAMQLENIVFATPIHVSSPLAVHINVQADERGGVAWEIYSLRGEDDTVHAQGHAVPTPQHEEQALDLTLLQQGAQAIDTQHLYAAYAGMGLHYGPSMRGVSELRVGVDGQGAYVLARLRQPSQAAGRFLLNPCLLDSALQASLGLSMASNLEGVSPPGGPSLPFAIDALRHFGTLPEQAWALIRPVQTGAQLHKLDIQLLDDRGFLCVHIVGYTSRVLQEPPAAQVAPSAPVTKSLVHPAQLLQPQWRDQAAVEQKTGDAPREHCVLLSEAVEEVVLQSLQAQLPQASVHVLLSKAQGMARRYNELAAQLMNELRQRLQSRPRNRVRLQLVVPSEGTDQVLQGLAAMLKAAAVENPLIDWQMLALPLDTSAQQLEEWLRLEAARSDREVRYLSDGQRQICGVHPLQTTRASDSWFEGMERPVVLITGGAGGLGLLFAQDFATRHRGATLVLSGRSDLKPEQHDALHRLRACGARVDYQQADISDARSVQALIEHIERQYGALHGVLHAAGVIRDNFLIKKTEEERQAVFAPKVQGLIQLDQATRKLALAFFVTFSSTSAVWGNVGQADYAAANAFMDAYMTQRQGRVERGERCGRSLSINWPLWESGGMQVDAAMRERLAERGVVPLQTQAGLFALRQALASDAAQVIVVSLTQAALREAAGQPDAAGDVQVTAAEPVEPRRAIQELGQPALIDQAVNHLKQLVSADLKVPVHRIDPQTPLEQYGMDSVTSMRLTNALEKTLGSLPKTLFFEYPSIAQLSQHLVSTHAQALAASLAPVSSSALKETPSAQAAAIPTSPGQRPQKASNLRGVSRRRSTPPTSDIAIVGISGVYPKAADMKQLWINLRDGLDCVQEVPHERWNPSQHFDPRRGQHDKTYAKWGSFIDGIAEFDPLLFRVSPREAAWMDPQVRLFLQTVWTLLESANLTREAIRERYDGQVGLYVGSMYQQYGRSVEQLGGEALFTVSSYSAIANRASHFFGFEGPSMAIDTMCSSSAMAVHLACQALQRDECVLAVAGGVNLSLDERKFIGLSQAQLLGSHANSRSFADGDGYLPAEGVGAVLLKPLARAVADGDRIHAVIKGSATTHSGHANAYSVPNPQLQARVMLEALRHAGVTPQEIGYVEAAANGSALGDPIELRALGKVFGERQTPCALGSVKSNFGHPEAVSGLAQLSKVVLQLQHRQWVPTIKAEPLNPQLQLSGTPFELQRELKEWQAQQGPRTALINSFGAGGSYVSLVLQEWDAPSTSDDVAPLAPKEGEQLVVLSARTPERLQVQAQCLLEHLRAAQASGKALSIERISVTLQFGREAMDARLALVVADDAALMQRLQAWLDGTRTDGVAVHIGDLQEVSPNDAPLAGDDQVNAWIQGRALDKLAAHWVSGGKLAWAALHGPRLPPMLELPTYPFEKHHLWLEANVQATKNKAPSSSLHDTLLRSVAQLLGVDASEIRPGRNLADYGLDSVLGMRLIQGIEASCGVALASRDLLAHSTIDALAQHLESLMPSASPAPSMDPASGDASSSNVYPAEAEILEMFRDGVLDLDEVKEMLRQQDLL